MFFRTGKSVEALIVQCSRRAQIVFAVILPVRRIAVDGKVFAHKPQIQEDASDISPRDNFDIFHVAQVLVVARIRAHDAAPAVAHQIVVRSERELQNRQTLVIDIAVSDRRIDVLVENRVVAMPDEFALVLVILAFDVSARVRIDTPRRRSLVPRKS